MNARFVLGLLLLVVGVGGILDVAGVWDFSSFAAVWWPAVLVLFGLVQLATRTGHVVLPVLLVVLGAYLLLRNLDVIEAGLGRYLWAVLAVVLGLVLLFGPTGRSRRRPRGEGRERPPRTEADRVHRFAAFGGFEERVGSRAFHGGDVTVLFGGGDLDLREATLADDATLTVTVLFGGLTLLVPEGTAVDTRGMPMFGGMDNKVEARADGPRLRLEGVVLFGGVEVRDKAKR